MNSRGGSDWHNQSKPAMQMGHKARAPKQALRIRHTGRVLRSTQNACIKQENLTKPRSESSLSMTKGEKLQVTKHSSHEAATKDYSLIFQRDSTSRYPDSENPDVKKSQQKLQNSCVSAEDLRSLVCLTQEQLQQILMLVKEGTRSISETHNEKQEEMAPNEASEENIIALLQKACKVSSVPDKANSDSSRKQEACPQPGQKVTKDSWKPADMFSTLGGKEGEKALLESRKTQWKKELDEQVALKKKLKETLEGKVGYFWAKPGNNETHKEKVETTDPDKTVFPAESIITSEENSLCTTSSTTESNKVPLNVLSVPAGQSSDLPGVSCTAFVFGEAVPQERPFSALKHEQQKKWLEELDKQKEEAKLRKIEEKLNLTKAEEHDRWAMHFDSLKNHLNANTQHPVNGMYKNQHESLCLSPDPKELTAFVHPFSPAALGNLMPLKVGDAEKAAKNSAPEHSQKVSFLRSMTALLDPAQIEERDRRRQKQLEHQKAIMAQVEEKRKKKQLEEEQRKWEEQEEEQRLAQEKEQMQKQFEEDTLKQKQKEELMTLKTNELYQTMQKAQELAQRLKHEQRIRDLAQKGHDISKLQKNLGGDTEFENSNTCLSHRSHNFSGDIKSHIDAQTSPRKDTAVQTDYFNTSAYTESAEERTVCCGSPDISIGYKETSNSKKSQKDMQYIDKNKISGKETGGIYSDLYEQYARKDRQIKPSEKYSKRPDWNINKPGKRYIPASERYPKQLQKQREENKVRRQMELLQLVERNTPGNLCPKKGSYSDRSPSPHKEIKMKNKGHRVRKEEQLHENHLNEERSESPPVPAVKNRLHQGQQKRILASDFLELSNNIRREKNTKTATQQRSSSPPVTDPFSQFIPYVRTNEVYYLDPDAPVTRPSTYDPQYRQFNDSCQMPRHIFSSDHIRDPLLNPDVVKIRERQQAILKGLSELRQVTAGTGTLRRLLATDAALKPLANRCSLHWPRGLASHRQLPDSTHGQASPLVPVQICHIISLGPLFAFPNHVTDLFQFSVLLNRFLTSALG
ncbi:coiled-coil domain-containing protein 66 isoform X2 [Falco rusticolus]|uniref:coiled-coil domain-containing protein 66 isoform X2 n=1 Tax=Falco cherrug TaxID=345164 RepID=UPI0018865E28|nr:coiled-coil domain-containing protein 66 isoform X2 [Falco cherrug]XP_037242668.1 coiled-coil domain-containing protein 66 isoform X2 [Falco rusticolus]